MTEPLKIVISVDTFAPDINGAARFAERIAGGLARRGHEVHVIAPAFDNNPGSRYEVHDGGRMMLHRLKSHRVPTHKTQRFVYPFGLTRKIKKILKEVNPVAVHVNSHLIIGRYSAKAARALGLRLIATNHIMPENLIKYSLIPKFLHGLAMKIAWADAGRVLRGMDKVTTPTRKAAELLENAAHVKDVLAISCGIEASRFANKTQTSNENPVFLFLGRLDDEKRIPTLLKAVALLKDFPKVRVELVGDGGERENLKRLARDLGIQDRVAFLGHIKDKDLPAAYERCTAFVMPSIAELQSIATMEAMASGRPVIAANAMALPHLVHDGDNGYLFPPDDVEALADRLRRILVADEAELQRLSENSLHLIKAHDIQTTLNIFENLFQGLGEESPTSEDNAPDYESPIGRLSENLRDLLSSWREDALGLQAKASELKQEAVEKLSNVRDDAIEKWTEVREEVREQVTEIKDEVTEAAKRLRKKKD